MPQFSSVHHGLADVHRLEPDGPHAHENDSDDLALTAVPGLLAGNEPLRRSTGDDPLGGAGVPDAVSAELGRRRGGGDALPTELAGPMGEHLGTDLSAVRIHTDSGSGALAKSIDAAAFTHGNDIYFAPGAYRPGSADGQHMLAHELSHVAAQRSGADSGGGASGLTVGHANDPAEAAADRSADSVMAALRRTPAERVEAQHGGQFGAATDVQGPLDLSALRRWRWPWQKGKGDKDLKSVKSGDVTILPAVFPKIATIGTEQVRVESQEEEDEANRIATDLKDKFGIDLSSPTTIEGIKNQYTKVPKKVTQKLKASVWSILELRALQEAATLYEPILGAKRGESTLKDTEQGVTTVGKLRNAIDSNVKKGKLDSDTLGEYFGGKKTMGMFDSGHDYVDADFVRPGGSGPDLATSLTRTALHEMAHGLVQPSELTNFIGAIDYWKTRSTKSGEPGAEIPITRYAQTNAAEDLCETVAMYFINRNNLQTKCPKREAFIDKVVKGWKPEEKTAVVDTATQSPGTEDLTPKTGDGE